MTQAAISIHATEQRADRSTRRNTRPHWANKFWQRSTAFRLGPTPGRAAPRLGAGRRPPARRGRSWGGRLPSAPSACARGKRRQALEAPPPSAPGGRTTRRWKRAAVCPRRGRSPPSPRPLAAGRGRHTPGARRGHMAPAPRDSAPSVRPGFCRLCRAVEEALSPVDTGPGGIALRPQLPRRPPAPPPDDPGHRPDVPE
jgi:hypothetical protein